MTRKQCVSKSNEDPASVRHKEGFKMPSKIVSVAVVMVVIDSVFVDVPFCNVRYA